MLLGFLVSNLKKDRGSRVCIFFFTANLCLQIFFYCERKGVGVALSCSLFYFILAIDQICCHFFLFNFIIMSGLKNLS